MSFDTLRVAQAPTSGSVRVVKPASRETDGLNGVQIRQLVILASAASWVGMFCAYSML